MRLLRALTAVTALRRNLIVVFERFASIWGGFTACMSGTYLRDTNERVVLRINLVPVFLPHNSRV